MTGTATSEVISVRNVSKKYKDSLALDSVDLTLEGGKIYGLLVRNGAGKTTLMSVLTAQNFQTSGEVRVFGQCPYENDGVLSRICFIRESQKYPDDFTAAQAFQAASMFFGGWDQPFADRLVEEFQLPAKRRIKKLSRGQLSAVGVIIGLASRAEITFFDEPYLGLDAVARQIFYDRLVQDFTEHPRTIVLSSHLIDEVEGLLRRQFRSVSPRNGVGAAMEAGQRARPRHFPDDDERRASEIRGRDLRNGTLRKGPWRGKRIRRDHRRFSALRKPEGVHMTRVISLPAVARYAAADPIVRADGRQAWPSWTWWLSVAVFPDSPRHERCPARG